MKISIRHVAVAFLLSVSALSVQAQQPKTAAINIPDLNPTEWFDGKMGGTFGAKTVTAFGKSNRIGVAGFRVVFVTHNEARAMVRASYMPGRDMSGAKSKIEVELEGVDDATLQAITDQAYATFIDQLKATGREVITPDQMTTPYAAFETRPLGQEVKNGFARGKAFVPAGMPLWWQLGDGWGDSGLSQKNMRAFNELSKSSRTVTIAPSIVVDFAQMQSSGNRSGFVARRAEVGTTLSMSVPMFTTRVVRAEETRYGGIVFKGDDGALAMTKTLDTDVEFADLIETSHSRGKKFTTAETNPAAYRAAAQAVLAKATGTFAKLLTANPAK